MSESPKPETFDEYYYNHDCGIPYERSAHWLNFFDKIAQQIIETMHPMTVLDAGCAWGFLVEALRNRGVEAYGIDISEYAISNVNDSIKPYCMAGSISEPFNRSYDLIVSIEVLEHMAAEEALKTIGNFCAHSEFVLFSSTPFDYKEVTHVNVRTPEYWAKNFSRYGYYRDMDYDATFITAWATLYIRRKLTPDRIVYEYERSHWPLVKENYDLRQSIAENKSYIEKVEMARDAAVMEAQHNLILMADYESMANSVEAEIESLKNIIASLTHSKEKLSASNGEEIDALKNIIASFKDSHKEQSSSDLENETLKNTIVTKEKLAYSKDVEIEELKNLISTKERTVNSKEAEIDVLNSSIVKHETRLQEINVHWQALLNSTTWKFWNKLGMFKDFPDLTT